MSESYRETEPEAELEQPQGFAVPCDESAEEGGDEQDVGETGASADTEQPARNASADDPRLAVATPGPGQDEGEDGGFYLREAQALAERQPERAALMLAEAATVAEHNGASETSAERIAEALELRPESAWLLGRARRLLMRLGRYPQACELMQRELRLGGENIVRAALLIECAAVARYAEAASERAAELIDNALKLQPRSVAVLACAVSLRAQLGRQTELATGLQQLGDYLGDPLERAQCLYAAGTLLETHLSQHDAAESAYCRALEADPQSVPAAVALSELHEIADRPEALCRTLEHLADLIEEKPFKARVLRTAGMLHLDRTRDLDSAARDLGRAARATPDDVQTQRLLVHAYEATGRDRETIQAQRKLLGLTLDGEGRASLLTRIGQLHAHLLEVEQAVVAYREALEHVPGYLPAVQALGSVYRERGEYDNLLAIITPETEGPLPVAARAVRYLELGEILDQKLHRPEEAAAAFRRALDLVPTFHLAYWALGDLLQRLGWHERLSDLLGEQSRHTTDEQFRTYLLRSRAAVEATALSKPERALATLQSLGSSDHAASVIFDLIALAQTTANHAELVALLLARAEGTTDPSEAEARRISAARILERQLAEHDRALQLYKDVLESNPTNYPAIHGAGRLLHGRGAWAELVRLHHHELKNAPDRADAATLLCRVGRILADNLGNRSAAFGAYAKALRRDPTCGPALAALDTLVREDQRWEELVEVLTAYAQARGSSPRAASALCRAAEVAGFQLGNSQRGVELYRKALADGHAGQGARDGLLRLHLRQEDWPAAGAALQELAEAAIGAEERAVYQFRLARIKEFRLDESVDLALYESASVGSLEARLRQECMRVRMLSAQQEPTVDRQAVAGALVQLGRQTNDDCLAAAHLLDAAHMLEFSGEAPDQAVSAAEQAFARRPDEPGVIWALERGLRQRGDWLGLGELYEREAQLELDRSVRVQHLVRAAQAFRRGGGLSEAQRVCRECLNFDAHCLPALRLLAFVAEQGEDWRALAELHDRLAEAAVDPSNRRDSCLQAASLWVEEIGDVERGLASLAVALTDDPGEEQAFALATRLLRSRSDYDELSRMFQRRIRACCDEEERCKLLKQHAALLRDDLDQLDRAIGELNALLALRPSDEAALIEVARLHEAQGHWSDAATFWGRVVEQADDPSIQQSARLQQAGLWINRLHEPRRARRVLDDALAARPSDTHAQRLRIELAITLGEWNDAGQRLEQLVDEQSPLALWALVKRGEVSFFGQRDHALTRACLQRAAEQLNGGSVQALGHDVLTEQDCRRCAEAIESVADQSDDDLRLFGVRLSLEGLSQPQRALEQLAKLPAEQHDALPVVLLRARAFEADGKPDQAVAGYRAALKQQPNCVAALKGLVRSDRPGVSSAAAAIVQWLGEAGPADRAQLDRLTDQATRLAGTVAAATLKTPPAFRSLADILSQLEGHLDLLRERPGGRPLPPGDPAVAAAATITNALGLPSLSAVEVCSAKTRAQLVSSEPRILCIDPELANDPSDPAFRFWVARALCVATGGGLILDQLEHRQIEAALDAIYGARSTDEEVQRLRKGFVRQLPRKVRKQLEQRERPTGGIQVWARYQRDLEAKAERIALAVAGQPATGLAELAKCRGLSAADLSDNSSLAELLLHSVSEEHAELHQRLWR